MSRSDPDRPAILGGRPVRPGGPPAWPRTSDSVQQVLSSMAASGDWGRYHGPHVPELTRRLAEYHSVEHALVCSSGTSAMELALRGAGVQEDDEVILAAYDFKSNFQNVLHLKATPVLVDLDPSSFQLDPSRLDAAITEKTRAIVASHLHGGVVPMPIVREIAAARGIAVVEDACQAPGATLFGRRAGTWGDVGIVSFGGSKLLTAGRGGAVITSRTEIAERIKRQVLRGNDAYPLSEIQAAILLPQLNELDALNERRITATLRITSQLSDLGGLIPLQLPAEGIVPAYYKIGFRYQPAPNGGLSRDQFAAAVRAEGIGMDPGFRSNHLIHASRRFRAADALTQATRADTEIITIYHPVLLESDQSLDEIAIAIQKVRRFAAEIAAVQP